MQPVSPEASCWQSLSCISIEAQYQAYRRRSIVCWTLSKQVARLPANFRDSHDATVARLAMMLNSGLCLKTLLILPSFCIASANTETCTASDLSCSVRPKTEEN